MHTNRLALEKSPYLLQHANNPVDWYPWGSEAFDKARREDKPVFLSVGYSTCHWCHVMERESFENEEIAALLNSSFVPVKVDREERPDVDRIYMSYVQATSGGGGWPMSVWLTPDLRPFFGGTYFPPDNRYGRPGFASLLQRLAEAWRSEREKILESSTYVLNELKKHSGIVPVPGILDEAVLESGFFAFRRGFDTRCAGFGGAPKFPRPVVLNFLLREYARKGNREALDMVLATLTAMANGGMHDQLGGGFHRYSVDDRWFLPHFEKMLYDQAQLAVSYLEAFQITRDEFYAAVARGILDYVLRDMTSPQGAFYSAEDADSVIDPARPGVKGEGAFYVWTRAGIEQLLGLPAADWFCDSFGVREEGNVQEDPHGEFPSKNILYRARDARNTAQHFGAGLEELERSLEESRDKLLAARAPRVRPHLDDKVLTGWNGLMISALALAARVLDEPRYEAAARRAADFLLETMYNPSAGTLLRRYRLGEAAIPGFLDDYAFLAQALLDLYETCFEPRYLEMAEKLTGKQAVLFEDLEHGAFFSTAQGDPTLVLRMKEDYDGAEPSGNSVAALNLLRLARITGRDDFRRSAERTLLAFASRLKSAPVGVPQMLAALQFHLAPPKQIVLAGDLRASETRHFLRALRSRFLPNTVVLFVGSDEAREALARRAPAIAAMTPAGGRTTAYVCENYACRLPVTDVDDFIPLLQ